MSPFADENCERADVNMRNQNDNSELMLESLLSYILFFLQSSTLENITKAVLGHYIPRSRFSTQKKYYGELIGQKVRKRGSNVRSEQDANLQDIIAALIKLGKVDELPCV